MVPPDTDCGLLRWCTLVMGLQVLGMFPFKLSKTHSTPKFSILLCLWSIFLQVTMIWMGILTFKVLVVHRITTSINSMAMAYCLIFLFASYTIVSFYMLVKSRTLGFMLVNFSKALQTTEPEKDKRCCQKGLVVFLTPIIFLASFILWYCIVVEKFKSPFIITIIIITTALYMSLKLTILQLSTKLFDLLTRPLVTAMEIMAKSSVHAVSANPEDFFTYRTRASILRNNMKILVSLHNMELKICQVSEYAFRKVLVMPTCNRLFLKIHETKKITNIMDDIIFFSF